MKGKLSAATGEAHRGAGELASRGVLLPAVGAVAEATLRELAAKSGALGGLSRSCERRTWDHYAFSHPGTDFSARSLAKPRSALQSVSLPSGEGHTSSLQPCCLPRRVGAPQRPLAVLPTAARRQPSLGRRRRPLRSGTAGPRSCGSASPRPGEQRGFSVGGKGSALPHRSCGTAWAG